MKAWLVAAAWATVASARAGCPPVPADGELLATGPAQLAWRAEPAPIVQGRPFVLLLTLCPVQARLAAVDATMPDHRHGMNYRPSLQSLGNGRWRADGLLWHMSGRWELRVDIHHEGAGYTLRRDVLLP